MILGRYTTTPIGFHLTLRFCNGQGSGSDQDLVSDLRRGRLSVIGVSSSHNRSACQPPSTFCKNLLTVAVCQPVQIQLLTFGRSKSAGTPAPSKTMNFVELLKFL
jgi:hypothetical protein